MGIYEFNNYLTLQAFVISIVTITSGISTSDIPGVATTDTTREPTTTAYPGSGSILYLLNVR